MSINLRRVLAIVFALVAGVVAHAQDGSAPSSVFPFPVGPQADLATSVLPEGRQEHFGDAFVRYFREGIWYFSFGYSREAWAPTNIHVSQPALGNNFTVYHVRATDDPSFDNPTTAQYNFRIGRYLDDDRTWAIELNFDHTKYTSMVGQTAQVTGTVAGKPVNGSVELTNTVFNYDLHNGANHVMFNLARFWTILGAPHDSFSVAAVGKIGVGPLIPHAENTILGETVNVGPKDLGNALGFHSGWWQFNGVTTGAEAGFRVNLTKAIYLEITDKVAFAQVWDVPVYQGTARHNLWMNEGILTLGFTFGGP